MGADLYIESEEFKAKRAYHREKFHQLIEQRNAIAIPGWAHDPVHMYSEGYTKYAELDRDVKAWLRTLDGKAYMAAMKAIDKNMDSEPGYFRDSYNYSSLFWNMNLSWWAIAGVGKDEPSPVIDDNGNISVDAARALREVVKATPIRPLVQGASSPSDDTSDSKKERQEWIDKMSAKEVAKWNKYFAAKKRKLIKFLSDAINSNAIIYASV